MEVARYLIDSVDETRVDQTGVDEPAQSLNSHMQLFLVSFSELFVPMILMCYTTKAVSRCTPTLVRVCLLKYSYM